MRTLVSFLLSLAALGLASACGDDDKKPADTADSADTSPDTADGTPDSSEDSADTGPDGDSVTPPTTIFAFRAAPGQAISEGPFPNDGLIGAGGTIALAPLSEDARFSALAQASILARSDAHIAARSAFGFISAAFFPMNAAPDLASFEGAVHYVALSGPEEGKVFPAEVFWFEHADYLGVFPAWGHYLVPGSTYGIVIDVGVKAADGRIIEAPPLFQQVIAAEVAAPSEEVAAARAAFAPLRAWLATKDQAAVIGTVFTTESTMTFARDLFAAVDAFTLVPPSANVRRDEDADSWVAASPVAGADLDAFFGVPAAPFAYTPTPWYAGTRADAALLPGGQRYDGGTFRGAIGYVVSGSFLAPAFNAEPAGDAWSNSPIAYQDGAPQAKTRAMVPFTVFLCEDHLGADGLPDATKTVPFAIFTHGGTAIRSDAVPFAVANCAAGYATITADLPFHGGRQETTYVAAEDVVAPTRKDEENVFAGSELGEEGFVPDGIGDNGDATVTVGGLFGLPSSFDPLVIEANHISISVEAYTLVRYLKEPGAAGLGAFLGTTIDADHLVMQSLSFGTSFTSALMAASDDFVGAVQSVGSSGMITLNLPMAPNNAALAGGVLRTVYGLASSLSEVNLGAHHDPVLAMLQWLSQRGDPAGYAPFVLRHRDDDHPLHVIGSGDSWDETLFSPAQMTFNAAWGIPTFTAGALWTLDATIPGAETVAASPYIAPLSANLTYGGRTQSAAYFYYSAACHSQVITPICRSGFQPPYPPATPRATPLVSVSPLCALQAPVLPFLVQLLRNETPFIGAPAAAGDSSAPFADACASLYAP